MSDEGELMMTEWQMNEQVFVPAGDGAPAQWKRMGSLTAGEFGRHVEWHEDEHKKTDERMDRRLALIAEARRRAGCNDVTILTPEEFDELVGLHMTIDATMREVGKRQAAIDRDISAGRCWVMGGRPKQKPRR